jgi:hypothetical protein
MKVEGIFSIEVINNNDVTGRRDWNDGRTHVVYVD